MGIANKVPASRTPRRFATSNSAITASPITTVSSYSPGSAEVIAATPAEIETATVST